MGIPGFVSVAFMGGISLFGQSSPLTVLLNGTPLGTNSVQLQYIDGSSSAQLIVVRSTTPVNFTVRPVGNWIVYALGSPSATSCDGANYSSGQLASTTPVGICISAVQPNPPLARGYYLGALTLTAGSGPLSVPVEFDVFPTGYLQLTMPYAPASNQQSFNGGTLSFSFAGGTPSPSTVHINVFDNNSVNSTPLSDGNDQHDQLFVSAPLNSDGSPAPWLLVNLTDPSTLAATSKSPALLNVSVDPTKAPAGSQSVQGSVSISSAFPLIGYDFVRVTASLPPSSVTGVANGASFKQAFAPGMLMSVFGTGLSNGSAQTVAAVPLPLTSLSGTSVSIDQWSAPLLYISANQINLQIPYEVPVGSHTLKVNSIGQSASIQFSVQAAAPGIFVDPQNHIVPSGSVPRGSTIALFVTGMGLVTPSEPTGGVPAAGTTPVPNLPLTITVGGVQVTPVYAGVPSWSVGELQVNFTVPSTPGTYPVVVTIGNVSSPPAMLTVTQ